MRYFVLGGLLCSLAHAGCSDHDATAAGPDLFIGKQDPSGCFASCPEHTPAPSAVALPDQCTQPAESCGFKGGEDKLRVFVDLHTVEVALTTSLKPPSLQLLLDGVLRNQPDAFPARAPGVDAARFAGVIPLPAQAVGSMVVRVDFGNGFGAEARGFTIEEPFVDLVLFGCEGEPCTRQAGVGRLAVMISAPADLGTSATINATLDGIPQPTTTIVELTSVEMGGTRRSGPASLAVPQTESVLWTLEARVGSYGSKKHTVELLPLDMHVEVPACPPINQSPCSLVADMTASVVVSAPKDLHDTTVTLVGKLDGLLLPEKYDIELSNVEGSVRTGAVKVKVPAEVGKTWQLVAHAGESSRSSVPITIVSSMPNP